jgi:raffinose/stachyose/melibiose transport system substrate-binding protein
MKLMSRKGTAIIAVLAAAALGACGAPSTAGNNASGGKVDLNAPKEKAGTLTMVTKFADPQYAPYFEGVVKAYEQANPKVKIQLQQVGDQPYKDKIRVLSASKQLPDIYFSWAGDFANKFVRGGLAADLTSVIGPDTAWGKTFSPAALKAFQTNGKSYGVPIDLDAKYMAYNKTAFAKAGISGPPDSLETLLSDCGKLKQAGYTPIAFGNQYGWPAIHYLTQLNAYDVPAATRDKDYNPATGAFTDPGYVTALTQFQSIMNQCATKDANGLAHEAGQANFINGKAGMHFLESLEFKVLTKAGGAPASTANSWGFFRLPAAAGSPGDTNALTGAPDGFMVNAQSKNAGLAVDFLKFMTSQQNAQKLTKDLGWLSPVQGSATAANSFPQLQDALSDINKASQFAIWLDTVTNADVANAYLSGAEGLVNGTTTPQAVMKSVQQAAAKAKKQVG